MVIVILTLTANPIKPYDCVIDVTMSAIVGREFMMEETEEV